MPCIGSQASNTSLYKWLKKYSFLRPQLLTGPTFAKTPHQDINYKIFFEVIFSDKVRIENWLNPHNTMVEVMLTQDNILDFA